MVGRYVAEIAWKNIWTAWQKCTSMQTTSTSKIMHDWLPVLHMQAHITGFSQCPNCTHPDETLDHIFHCTHLTLLRKREENFEHLQKKRPRTQDTLCNHLGYPHAPAGILLQQLTDKVHLPIGSTTRHSQLTALYWITLPPMGVFLSPLGQCI